ncbi:MAG: hypothetical protein KatS3mg027_0187 [Bacteroidia bacterium]|nr:MAG: hypothetical protein KatS3mg027_0187 [Bacteroidia bacterium]
MTRKNKILLTEEKNVETEEEKTIKEKATSVMTKKSSASKGIIIRMFYYVFGGQYFETHEIQNHIKYFLLLVGLGILYINNGNKADKKIRDINKLNKELKELRSQYIITQSELMFLSKQSEVAKRVEPIGLKETTQQPYLILNKDTTNHIY